MPKARSPNRDKAFELWKDSGGKKPLIDIAAELGISDVQVRKWKNVDQWEERLNGNAVTIPNSNVTNQMNSNVTIKNKGGAPKGNKNAVGHGAPKGNKNALGNHGGAPPGNKNAVTTGEFETIWWDCLTEEEQALCNTINTDTLAQVEDDLKLISLRERRMMERIRKRMDGLTEKQRKVLHELRVEKNPIEVYDEKTGQTKVVVIPEPKLVVTEITETECRAIDDILKLEEALTRVQEKKTRLIALKHSIETANKGSEGTAAAQDHAKRVQEAWANR
ncbi:phage terminase small subunit [Lucifera butyrica]|uniref:Phage terminase small subunit n=1 Tax=Lucifera butyrica TaxID=1351585 RepID=A0A498R447_9FIRM|nr:phage terminase small subunit [Lucifera butyrica]VBB05580.1 phage terminase small subunit [Lucifera butyrica]